MSTTPSPSILGPGLRAIGAVCLVLGPIAFSVAEYAGPDASGSPDQMLAAFSADRIGLAVAIVASLLSVLFFIAGLFLLAARRLERRGRVLLPLGLGITLVAMLANTALLGVNVLFLSMTSPSLDQAQMAALIGSLVANPFAPVLLSGHYVLVVGFVLVGLGLWRAGIGPAWAAWFVALCGVVDAVGGMFGAIGDQIAGAVSDGMMIAGFAVMGWFLLREGVRGRGTAAPVAEETPAAGATR